jgi:ABC-2 type transport system ATP-binding protein
VIGADAQARMGHALAAAGVPVQARGGLLALDPAPELGHDVHDLIRDTAFDLGVGLVRIQADHRRIEDVFADA